MRVVMVMKAEEGSALPTADDLRRAGLAVSEAVGPARGESPPPGPPQGDGQQGNAPAAEKPGA